MRADDLINSVKLLEKIKAKQDEIDKVSAKHQAELGELIAQLPAGVRGLLAGENPQTRSKSNGERRERITLSGDDKELIPLLRPNNPITRQIIFGGFFRF